MSMALISAQKAGCLALTALVLVPLAALHAAGAPKPASKPNILILLADDMGYGDPGCYNPKSKIATPHIDRLAREGMRFTDAHAPRPLCHPSRCPGAEGYEVAGFFFWQGEKDCGNAVHAARYEQNLVRFIKQVRKHFSAPDAKFVLATLGESTKGSGGNGGTVLNAQLAVEGSSGKYPEFKGNVATVYSNPLSKGGSGNSHYNGHAETYMDVGEAMGKAMVNLLKHTK